MKSLGYMLLYFLCGSLPWQGLTAETDKELNALIKEKKMEASGEALFEGFPREFAAYVNHIRSLRFGDRPDYARLRRDFRRLFRSRGFGYDSVFDWTEKMFNEIHGGVDETSSPASGKGGGN